MLPFGGDWVKGTRELFISFLAIVCECTVTSTKTAIKKSYRGS